MQTSVALTAQTFMFHMFRFLWMLIDVKEHKEVCHLLYPLYIQRCGPQTSSGTMNMSNI